MNTIQLIAKQQVNLEILAQRAQAFKKDPEFTRREAVLVESIEKLVDGYKGTLEELAKRI